MPTDVFIFETILFRLFLATVEAQVDFYFSAENHGDYSALNGRDWLPVSS
jgi:hypothetical protein